MVFLDQKVRMFNPLAVELTLSMQTVVWLDAVIILIFQARAIGGGGENKLIL